MSSEFARSADRACLRNLSTRDATLPQIAFDTRLHFLVDLVEEQQQTTEQERNRRIHTDRQLDTIDHLGGLLSGAGHIAVRLEQLDHQPSTDRQAELQSKDHGREDDRRSATLVLP